MRQARLIRAFSRTFGRACADLGSWRRGAMATDTAVAATSENALISELQSRLKVPRSSQVPKAEHVALALHLAREPRRPKRPRASGRRTSSRATRARASRSSPSAWSTRSTLQPPRRQWLSWASYTFVYCLFVCSRDRSLYTVLVTIPSFHVGRSVGQPR